MKSRSRDGLAAKGLLSVDRSSVNQDVDCGPIKGIARHLTAKAFITLDPKKLLSFIFIIT